MTKLWTRLYPVDIERMQWLPVDGARGVFEKRLAHDPANDSQTRYLRVEPDGVLRAAQRATWEETYVLDGVLRVGADDLPRGSYVCQAPDTQRSDYTSTGGCVVIQALDYNPNMDKPNVVVHAQEIAEMPFAQTPLRNAAHQEKILARGPSGSVTRLLWVGLDGDTTTLDDHTFDEEVLILEGSVKNGEEFHPAGTYTFNAPHDTHGPFVIVEPLLCYELRNFS